MKIPKAKYKIGEKVLVTDTEATRYFGTVSQVETHPDTDSSNLKFGQMPILYKLEEIIPRHPASTEDIYLWEHEIAEALPNQ